MYAWTHMTVSSIFPNMFFAVANPLSSLIHGHLTITGKGSIRAIGD